jgi:hypothetical protein
MRRLNLPFLVVLVLFLAVSLSAQVPQHYNANSGGIGNTIPFGSTGVNGYMSQYLMLPGEFAQPTPAPAGNITKLYIYMSSTGGPATYSHLTIMMGQATITVFPTGSQYTGPLDTVYHNASATLSSTANNWLMITLNEPFTYNPAQSLIIQISQCSFTGTGMSVWQTAGTTGVYRRNNLPGTPACTFTYSSQDGRILQCGVDISAGPVPSNNYTLLFPTPGVNTNYVAIPHQSSMIGFGNNITIEGWVKIGGTTTPNTVLNKGGSSFDYQLGINSSTANPFFRAGSTIVLGSAINIPVGVWTHLAVVSNGTSVTFFVNGVSAQTVPSAATLGSSANEMRIGRGGSDPASGRLDEIRLWSVARTPTQISSNMCVKYIPSSTTGLKAVWHLDSNFVDSISSYNGSALGNVGFDTMTFCPIVTGITGKETGIPESYKLSQNYPNPFNPSTNIEFSIPKNGYVELKIYNLLGKEVATLVSDPYQAGSYIVSFDASTLSSGIYFYKISVNDFVDTKKMMLIK